MKKKFGSVILLLLLIAKTPVFAQNNQIGLNWQKCLGGSGNDVLQELITLPNGDVMVLATTTSNNGDVTGNHGAEDIWVVRVNASSSILWQRCIGGTAKDSAVNMLITPDGGLLVSGITLSTNGDATGNHGQQDALVTRLDANGNILWSRCLGGTANDKLIRLTPIGNNGFTLFGETSSNNGDVSGNHGGSDLWAIHLDNSGTPVWQRCYGGSQNETATDFLYLPQHNAYLLLGIPRSSDGDMTTDHINKVAWLIKADMSGNITGQITAGFVNSIGVANGMKYIPAGLVRDNSEYGFVFTEDGDYSIGFSSTRRHAKAFIYHFNPANITQLRAGEINDRPSEYINETDGSKGIVRLKEKTGGGYLMVEDYMGCYFMDNSGWAFVMQTPKSGLTSGRFNASGYRPRSIQKVRAVCNNTFYPNQTSRGDYFSGDAFMPDENLVISGGRTNDLDRNPNFGGSHDAYLARGSSASFFGGSGNDGFIRLARIDDINFYAGGFTTSNNGQVSGNHGGDEIWLVNARLSNNRIKGTVYVDLNSNGTKDAGEPWANSGMISSQNNFIDIQSGIQNGLFANLVGTGTFTSSVVNLPAYFTAVPPSITTSFTGFGNTDSIGFALRPVQNFNDLAVNILPEGVARPGFPVPYKILYKNNGTQTATGIVVSFVKDSRLTVLSSNPGGYSTIGDTLRWNLPNLTPLQEGIIQLNLQVPAPPVVNNGDTLRSKAIVEPMGGDITPVNNTMLLNQLVQGAYDPNDKLENHAGKIGRQRALAGEELVYTIRFQNTGTDTAFNIYIRDTLPLLLNASTLRVINASHPYTVEASGTTGFGEKVFTFRFNNILLPDSGTNNTASNGFISFAIKAGNNIFVGDKINNSASIYFDYNESVITPKVSTLISGVPRPQVSMSGAYCSNTTWNTGKVLNPPVNVVVTTFLNNAPIPYNPADSTFTFNISGLSTTVYHTIKVLFTSPEMEQDSFEYQFYITVPQTPVINNNDTVLCHNSPPLLLSGQNITYWNVPINNTVQCFSNCVFNPQQFPVGTYKILATKNNNFPCPKYYDTLTIQVVEGMPPVITNNDTSICVLSPPLTLQANMPAIWSGAGVSSNIFNAASAGPGVHRITATNAACNSTADTLTITVSAFVQAVISTPNQTVCKLSAPISLQANTTVTWSGNGVSGSTFNPATAGVGTHQIIATKTNGTCPDSKDTLMITVDDFVQAVISTPNQTICTLSGPLSLQANTTVTWSGTGVSGSSFNPATAGAGVHQIIATKTNGTCPDTKDTLTITVDDFVQAVITTPNQTVCKLSAPISLQANTTVTWSGSGVSGSTFNPATAGAGTHQIIATKNNGVCPESKDTLTITVDDFVQAVISTPNQTICKLAAPISLQANTAVSWSGTGVSGAVFNPVTAGAGTHQIIATKTNGTCPDSKDTLTITVDDVVQAVIATPNQTICKLSAPISLQANTTVTWSGNGVSGSTFNPAVAGAGTHQIIATKNNGVCPESKDTLVITVNDFIKPVILNNDTVVCILDMAFSLRSDIPVSWAGPGVSGSTFNPATAGTGTHLLFAIKTNGVCADGRDTLVVTVTNTLTPDVNLNASQNTLNSAGTFSDLTAINAAAGGPSPLYTFAAERNFTQVLRAESGSISFRVLPQMLNAGSNFIYVRMRSSGNCLTTTIAIDSVQINLVVNTPSKSELEQALKVFPNPNNGQFGFRFETGINDRVLVTVFDAIGKQVFKQDYGQVQQFNFGKTLDLRNRHAGRYTIQFRVGSIVITRKVNVLR